MFRTINQTVSNLRSSLPSRGTGEFVESPAHKVSVMVGGQRQQEDLGGGPPPCLESGRAPRRAPWWRIFSREQWGVMHGFQVFVDISPGSRG